jgi:hypothetical protein
MIKAEQAGISGQHFSSREQTEMRPYIIENRTTIDVVTDALSFMEQARVSLLDQLEQVEQELNAQLVRKTQELETFKADDNFTAYDRVHDVMADTVDTLGKVRNAISRLTAIPELITAARATDADRHAQYEHGQGQHAESTQVRDNLGEVVGLVAPRKKFPAVEGPLMVLRMSVGTIRDITSNQRISTLLPNFAAFEEAVQNLQTGFEDYNDRVSKKRKTRS